MAIIYLRVDEADSKTALDQLSKFLRCKKSFIATFICTNRLGIKIPRDIRKLIALKCTVPIPSKMDCSLIEYYRFYVSHATTQKYNPHILVEELPDFSTALFTLVYLTSAKYQIDDFRHPFGEMLREPSIMMLQPYTFNDLKGSLIDGSYVYELRNMRYGEVIAGIVCDQMIRGLIYIELSDVTIFDKFKSYDNNVLAFNIISGKLVDKSVWNKRYRPACPPKINRPRNGIWVLPCMYDSIIKLITKNPIDKDRKSVV